MSEDRDEAAFGRQLMSAYPYLLRLAVGLSKNQANALDLVHDTIERAWRQRGRLVDGAGLRRWLAIVLRRLFIDNCRHARVAAALGQSRDVADAAVAEEPLPAAPWEPFSLEDVQRAVLFLKPALRRVYTMFAIERLSYAEIGHRLSIPSGTVATRVHRARQQLRKLLVTGAFLRPLPGPSRSIELGDRLSPFIADVPANDVDVVVRTPPPPRRARDGGTSILSGTRS